MVPIASDKPNHSGAIGEKIAGNAIDSNKVAAAGTMGCRLLEKSAHKIKISVMAKPVSRARSCLLLLMAIMVLDAFATKRTNDHIVLLAKAVSGII